RLVTVQSNMTKLDPITSNCWTALLIHHDQVNRSAVALIDEATSFKKANILFHIAGGHETKTGEFVVGTQRVIGRSPQEGFDSARKPARNCVDLSDNGNSLDKHRHGRPPALTCFVSENERAHPRSGPGRVVWYRVRGNVRHHRQTAP